jgi:N-methylhydantoinase A
VTVTVTVSVYVPAGGVAWAVCVLGADRPATSGGSGDGGSVVSRPVVFDRGAPPVEAPVYRRDRLAPGTRFDGPAVVEERETTSVIRPGWAVEVADDGSLIATRGSR